MDKMKVFGGEEICEILEDWLYVMKFFMQEWPYSLGCCEECGRKLRQTGGKENNFGEERKLIDLSE